MSAPRIALIHALEESVSPARHAFLNHWPQAKIFDLLDTSLATDLAERGHLEKSMIDRFLALGRYTSESEGVFGPTKGILFTCSAFGPAIDAVKQDRSIPVRRPNEAAFREALAIGDNIGLVVTFAPALPLLTQELHEMSGRKINVQGIVIPEALAALKSGDFLTHDRLVAEKVASFSGIDTLILGQFSLARARSTVEAARNDIPIITTPEAAVRDFKRILG